MRATNLFERVFMPPPMLADKAAWRTSKGGKRYQLDTETGEILKGNIGQNGGKSFDDYRKACGGDHYKAAQAYYVSEMMPNPAKTMIEGQAAEVAFGGGRDKKKMWQDMQRDPVKAEALQHVKEVIESGKYLGASPSNKQDDRFTRYHYFQKEIPMKDAEGNSRKLIVDVGERGNGQLEYRAHSFIHNKEPHYSTKVQNLRGAGMQAEDKKKSGCPSHGFSRPNTKSNRLFTDANIPQSGQAVNLPAEESALLQSEITAGVIRDIRAMLRRQQQAELAQDSNPALPEPYPVRPEQLQGPFRFLTRIKI